MRSWGPRLVLAAAMAVGGVAHADRMPEPEPPPAPPEPTFWEWLADPAAAEVAVILEKTASVVGALEDPGAEIGDELLGDVYGMLRYGLGRAPDHPDLLLAMGVVADAMGRTRQALTAFERMTRVAPEHARAAEAWVHAGYARARLGDDDGARDAFHYAIARPLPRINLRDDAVIGLAWLHLRNGHATRAIALLENTGTTGHENPLPKLVLAIALDRDGQLTRAYHVVRELTKTRPLIELVTQHSNHLAALRYLDPLDRHYVAAFVYEMEGMLEDALAEWQLYARASEAPYRARAHTHARDVAALLAARTSPRRGATK